eukprot:CAMPEP_0114590628 /NCGR_PEP_ID=MMETSP0125-20121206/12845_1 /TAXON_ID=485358 ORGANISM="Aristerostoma sp., Strain ATCC 50986" /NCGR_SAMPLE_ID=MMETSP0125 /ASSEMBLY_ACC=CAM_ASM_000245 /LENGTH=150 /DNA_ID=CAMNT_0001788243 /DNA_START=469 /DNA_END=921 /DNA_ORIENTATION=+
MTFYSVYKYHKKRFSVPEYHNLTKRSAINFAIGCVSAIFYVSWIIIGADSKSRVSEIPFQNGYLITSVVYNFINLMIMRHVISDGNKVNPQEKFLFTFKNIFFMVIAIITIAYFVLDVSILLVSYSVEPVNAGIFNNYLSLLGGLSVLLN